jgi:hypothetical protein
MINIEDFLSENELVDHIRGQDRREFPGLAHSSGSPALRMPSMMRSRCFR